MRGTYILVVSGVFVLGMVVGSLITSKATPEEEQTVQSKEQIINAMQRHLEEEELQWRLKQIKEEYPLSEEESQEISRNLRKVHQVGNPNPPEVLAFFKVQGEKTIPILAEALNGEDKQTRQDAIKVLWGLSMSGVQDEQRYEDLAETITLLTLNVVEDEDPLIRKYAVYTLAEMARRPVGPPVNFFLREKIVGVLVQRLDDPNETLKRGVAEYLEGIGLSQYLPENLRRQPLSVP